MRNVFIFTIAMLLAGAGGFTLQKYLSSDQAKVVINPAVGMQRVEFSAPDENGEIRNIREWDGKIVFLNFWATWCPPCKDEIPHFIELQQEYGDQGLQFIGVAIDEHDAVTEFADEIGMNYPSMIVQDDGVELARRYGNGIGILPYTVIIDRDGRISNTFQGPLSKKRAIELLEERGVRL
jgi:thiol-disulfide isomerase/thioredoxin